VSFCIECGASETILSSESFPFSKKKLKRLKKLVDESVTFKIRLESQIQDFIKRAPHKSQEIQDAFKSKIKSLDLYSQNLAELQMRVSQFPYVTDWIKKYLKCHHNIKDDIRLHGDILYHERDYSIPISRPNIKTDWVFNDIIELSDEHLLLLLDFTLVVIDRSGREKFAVGLSVTSPSKITKDWKGGFYAICSTDSKLRHYSANLEMTISPCSFSRIHVSIDGKLYFFQDTPKTITRVTESGSPIWTLNVEPVVNIAFSDSMVFLNIHGLYLNVHSIETGQFCYSINNTLSPRFKIAPYSEYLIMKKKETLDIRKETGRLIGTIKIIDNCCFQPLTDGTIAVGNKRGEICFI
jgi:hypothetical protein